MLLLAGRVLDHIVAGLRRKSIRRLFAPPRRGARHRPVDLLPPNPRSIEQKAASLVSPCGAVDEQSAARRRSTGAAALSNALAWHSGGTDAIRSKVRLRFALGARGCA